MLQIYIYIGITTFNLGFIYVTHVSKYIVLYNIHNAYCTSDINRFKAHQCQPMSANSKKRHIRFSPAVNLLIPIGRSCFIPPQHQRVFGIPGASGNSGRDRSSSTEDRGQSRSVAETRF